jgi:protein SCO1/2
MRLLIHLGLILLVGVGLGFGLRSLKKNGASSGVAGSVVSQSVLISESSDSAEPSDAIRNGDWMTEWKLTERSGRVVSRQELLGTPHIVSFFFSTCPSICVMQNQKLQQLQQEFAGKPVRFLSISVDPEVDRPEALAEYAKRFGADKEQWLFLTADDVTYVRRVAGEVYRVHADKQVHVERFILIDPKGEQVGVFSWADDRQWKQLCESIRQQLTKS